MEDSVAFQNDAFKIALPVQNDATHETILKYQKVDFSGQDGENVPFVQTFQELP